uniref:Ig-like domain-containing protein n=1 Tax=Malurus cyaneus samueli TaxID=2593467 RepID=A0A8C5UJN9_9PASS
CCCLLSFLLYLFLLSWIWANLEVPSPSCQPLSHIGTFTVQLLQTSTFQNTSFVDTEGLGLLEDIELGSLDKHTWSVHFYQPWVCPALPQSDWDTTENLLKIYLQQFNTDHVYKNAQPLMQLLSPLSPARPLCGSMHGCELYPNRTSWTFAYVGYNGQDFFSFATENASWTLSQDTNLSWYVWSVLHNYTPLTLGLNHTPPGLPPPLCSHSPELPVATVFARTPSLDKLLLICHITGFYPRPISMAWLQDGCEVPPLNTSTILTNADLTHQLHSILAVAPVMVAFVLLSRHWSPGRRGQARWGGGADLDPSKPNPGLCFQALARASHRLPEALSLPQH